jgi:hypothetical protein
MLEHESVLNNEYDILLLPRGAWARYATAQKKF